ncbi:nitroreductase/quinone reductase family protein [Streptomyces sp. NPDC045456]|uniref:nitroreductase/quinone reductase family protein n=1 Tax=Streptomyces sp. NPDC045456 TaxID=3155254 RepID=UPI00340092CA
MRSQPRTGHNHRIRPAPGRRTGRCHTVPLYAFADGSWLVVPTNFGRDRHPAWSTNLLHHPHATLTWRSRQHQVAWCGRTNSRTLQRRGDINLTRP